MSYPRKRASVACDFCRYKKRRCDGRKPVCGNCEESHADCIYQNLTTQRFVDTSSVQIQQRLEKIEELLSRHDHLLLALSKSPTPPLDYERHQMSADYDRTNGSVHSAGVQERMSSYSHSPETSYTHASVVDDLLPPLTIPAKHDTSAIRVIALPQIRSLIGEYPLDYFYNIESRRVSPWVTESNMLPPPLPFLDREVCDTLVSSYISTVHPHHPVIDHSSLLTLYEAALETGLMWDLDSAIVMVVLALGMIASSTPEMIYTDDDGAAEQIPGMEFFHPAYRIIWDRSASDLSASTAVAQGLVLAGVYLSYLARPISSWKLIHAASTNVQLNLVRTQTSEASDVEVRLFWSCFLIESDRLAEFELPRSGIETLVDDITLPRVLHPPEPATIYFLAEISIRRLLNRVHNSLYTTDGKVKPIKSLLTICDELNRQLEIWLESIPDPVRPTLGTDPAITNDREIILRIRYYATRHIIFRPFVLRVISHPDEDYGGHHERVLENCGKCVESIRMYIHNIGHILAKPTPYTWTLSQSSLGALLVVTAASKSSTLASSVPDVSDLQKIVLQNIRPWAQQGSSIKSVLHILEHIQFRQQL